MSSTITFTGLPSAEVFAGYGTHCRGPHPSTFFLVVKPYSAVEPPIVGDLVLTDTDSGLAITFKNCEVDKPWLREHYGKDPQCMWHIRILDRRVQWANQYVTYEANVRCPDGTIQPWSKKTAKDIASELLDLMGETGYDVSEVSDLVYPYVAFSGPPAFALSDVMARLGGSIVLKSDDSVAICWPGNGTDIANSDGAFTTYHKMPTRLPSSVKVICGDTWWESMFDLEAVGMEYSGGEVKAIDSLAYTPADGWESQWPTIFADVEQGGRRSFAFRSVYRWYRITSLSETGLTPTDADESVTNLNQLLPLRAILCRGEDVPSLTDQMRSPECEVYGVWWPYSDHPYNTGDCQLYPGGFDLEEESGIVKFHEPVFKLSGGSGATSWCPDAADLKLFASHRLRLADGTYQRKEFDYPVSGGTGEPLRLYFPELFLVKQQFYATCETPITADNETELEAEADEIAGPIVFAIENRAAVKRIEYPFIQPWDLDGDVHQVQYAVNQFADGMFPTRTIVSVGAEGDYYEQSQESKQKAAITALAVTERMLSDTPRRKSPYVTR